MISKPTVLRFWVPNSTTPPKKIKNTCKYSNELKKKSGLHVKIAQRGKINAERMNGRWKFLIGSGRGQADEIGEISLSGGCP